MRLLAVLTLIAGMAAAILMILSHGAGNIWHAVASLGWGGLAAVLAFHLGLIALMGVAWGVLARAGGFAGVWRFVWGRLIRDSGAEALPLSQIGGFVLGARAVALAGVPTGFAAASTVVDVTVELVAQLAYVLVGLGMLQVVRPHNGFGLPVAGGIGLMTVLVTIFIAVQARGAGMVETVGMRAAGALLGRQVARSGGVQQEIRGLHAHPVRLLGCTCIHFLCWLLSAVETWMTLRIMGIGISLPAAVVVDSLLYGFRSLSFMVPNALGVQEAALVFLGALFGVGASEALALSLIKRGRDLLIGAPALLAWQALEGRRAWSHALAPSRQQRPDLGSVGSPQPPRPAISPDRENPASSGFW